MTLAQFLHEWATLLELAERGGMEPYIARVGVYLLTQDAKRRTLALPHLAYLVREEAGDGHACLYQVDYNRTKVNDIYKESDKRAVKFKTPVELPVVYELGEAEMKSYNNQMSHGIYAKTGKLTFSVLISTLEEYGCDINRGDYIGVQIDSEHREYFTVTDDGRVGSTANKFSMFGTTPFARTIEAAPVDEGEFNG